MRNRGKHPGDDHLFDSRWQPIFIHAVADMSYLLTRGYGERSSLEIVGNQYKFTSRQRKALARMSVPDELVMLRNSKKRVEEDLKDKTIEIDGFNTLILLENCLSGAYIFECRDGVYRDISGVHGSYKRVIQTAACLEIIYKFQRQLEIHKINWYLDKPVSNSGRLKKMLEETGTEQGCHWTVYLNDNPDRILSRSTRVVVTSDGLILDQCRHWFNLISYLLDHEWITANVMHSKWKLIP